jgi:hypothetical protein
VSLTGQLVFFSGRLDADPVEPGAAVGYTYYTGGAWTAPVTISTPSLPAGFTTELGIHVCEAGLNLVITSPGSTPSRLAPPLFTQVFGRATETGTFSFQASIDFGSLPGAPYQYGLMTTTAFGMTPDGAVLTIAVPGQFDPVLSTDSYLITADYAFTCAAAPPPVAPVPPPVAVPVSAPVPPPVAAPVSAPVVAPPSNSTEPVEAPVEAPVAPPEANATAPVEAPASNGTTPIVPFGPSPIVPVTPFAHLPQASPPSSTPTATPTINVPSLVGALVSVGLVLLSLLACCCCLYSGYRRYRHYGNHNHQLLMLQEERFFAVAQVEPL